MNAFSICFHSIYYSEGAGLLIDNVKIIESSFARRDSGNSDCVMSNDGVARLEMLFNAFVKASNSTINLDYFVSSLDKSIFAFCVPDGYIMINCSVDHYGAVKFCGFFLRKDESLRTAWKLAKWQLLLLCAMNWNPQEMTYLSLDEIDRMVKTSDQNMSQRYQDSIVQMGQQIMTADIPFTFAVSGYSLKKLPFDFNSAKIIKISEGTANLRNGIVMNEDDLYYHFKVLSTQYNNKWHIQDIRLIPMSSREYLQCVEKMWDYDKKKLKDEKAAAKNQLHSYQGNEIWCFMCRRERLYYYQIAPAYLNDQLLNGKVHAATIFVECERKVLKSACEYYQGYYDYMNDIKEQQMREAKKMEDVQHTGNSRENTPPEKKEGKIKSFFHQGKDD